MPLDIVRLYCEGEPFAVYRFPGQREVHTALRGNGDFRICPWLSAASAAVSVSSAQPASPDSQPWSVSTPYAAYIAGTQRLVDGLRRRGGKCVRMRAICGNAVHLDLNAAVSDLFDSFPDAFCHCYYTPSTGMWIGATPEVLADIEGDVVRTMSLAGTRPAECSGPWDGKNIAEQAMVTEFIVEALDSLGCRVETGPRESLRYGPIEHLCTRIKAHAPGIERERILDRLSPTPAVAGLPRDIALKEIVVTEDAPRRCYAGYVAVDAGEGRMVAYVNLRCAQVSPSGWCIYAGGGITADSDPAAEWLETEAKASTLRSILEKNSLS